jgi:hypothetical protein
MSGPTDKPYTLWLRFRRRPWRRAFTISGTAFGLSSKQALVEWAQQYFAFPYWRRGKTWMVLPQGKRPAGLSTEGAT